MDNAELKQLLIDATLAKVYSKGVAVNKAVASYVRGACVFVDNPDGSPQLKLVDPTSGVHYDNAERFAEVLAKDEDFRPRATASHSEPAKPRHVHADDLAKEYVRPEDVMSGKVIVEIPERPIVEAKQGEVSIRDQRALNRSIEDIASGKVQVV